MVKFSFTIEMPCCSSGNASDNGSAIGQDERDDPALRIAGGQVYASPFLAAEPDGWSAGGQRAWLVGGSGDTAQGRLTDADEVVGEITAGGTIGIIVFAGLFAAVITAFGYLVVRRWLPRTAGPAGVVVGILLLGTMGVGDALSSDNVDFAILRPTWLAVTLIVVLALLFGVTFTALAARLEAGMPTLSSRPSSIAAHSGLVFVLFPPVALGAAAYVAGRAAIRGELAPVLATAPVRRAGHVVVGVAVALTALNSARVIEEIISA